MMSRALASAIFLDASSCFLGAASNIQLRWRACAQVREGIVPNEHGTWQYGRNGWCDGQQVGMFYA